MKNVIFIAPPAAGKGTQSEILVQRDIFIFLLAICYEMRLI